MLGMDDGYANLYPKLRRAAMIFIAVYIVMVTLFLVKKMHAHACGATRSGCPQPTPTTSEARSQRTLVGNCSIWTRLTSAQSTQRATRGLSASERTDTTSPPTPTPVVFMLHLLLLFPLLLIYLSTFPLPPPSEVGARSHPHSRLQPDRTRHSEPDVARRRILPADRLPQEGKLQGPVPHLPARHFLRPRGSTARGQLDLTMLLRAHWRTLPSDLTERCQAASCWAGEGRLRRWTSRQECGLPSWCLTR
eukprot:747594-Hanusia_phi.AAC.3